MGKMDYHDWSELGSDIRRMVDDAVNSGDFRRLDENIRRTVTDGLENLGDSLRKGMESITGEGQGKSASSQNGPGGQNTGGWRADGRSPRAGREATSRSTGRNGQPQPTGWNRQQRPADGNGQPQSAGWSAQPASRKTGVFGNQSPLFARTFGARAGGMALLAVGCTVAGGSLIAILIFLIMYFAGLAGTVFSVMAGILAVAFAAALVAVGTGKGFLGKAKRFDRYVEALKGRTYCSIEELAAHVGKSQRYVKNDLQKMISSRWFRQGHLDRKETCLIVSEETYRQYQESEKQLELRRKEEQERAKKTREENEGLSEEVRKMMEAGNAYIEKIKRSNDAIPGEEISNKISRMQIIVERIFERVREYPDCADELRRFMDYYLPTTVKLLDAYEELDRQPVQGENIRNRKLEIEKTLDTLNLAFEKLLDSLFEDTAWDVATDISVLQTMLAQEGLTEQKLKADK